ncbi:P-loop containing nucleoside triphosphate hydrolase protein [Dichotomocladium elegans]|nr:P-loop containing nucleoside triphosphate hydrolase protein [Dichotomocladium elegans]
MGTFGHSDHILLNVPGRGATYMIDNIVLRIAADVGTDVVMFDPQDFVSLVQVGDGRVMTLLPSLTAGDRDSPEQRALLVAHNKMAPFATENEDENGYNDYDVETSDDYYESLLSDHGVNNSHTVQQVAMTSDNGNDDKTETKQAAILKLVEKIISRYHSMFERMLLTIDAKNVSSSKIVYLRDYSAMIDPVSILMQKALLQAVEQLRQKGHQIIVVAGYSPPLSTQSFNYKDALEDGRISAMSGMKCISIPPPLHNPGLMAAWEAQLKLDSAKRIGEVNGRQLLAILLQKDVIGLKNVHGNNQMKLVAELGNLEGIRDTLWSPAELDRHATCAIGNALKNGKTSVGLEDLATASRIVRPSILRTQQTNRLLDQHRIQIKNGEQLNLMELEKVCNEYESRLLSRVVDPSKVQCSFADIRAPPSTIDTLQTLISLPLVRPDLFQKGILKKNFISGVLLFGPPGTGKTMLAKAVAKESGSRMLEIQASDIYEMYLGEGEKNVKALFSLARKLSPCVIFIDEVDSLMSQRRSDSTSNAHREIINQFMVEWDGLTSDNQGVIIMAATNRPFDLDDAVLRRMPRRLLVDLPKEEDRMAILNILLRDEEHEVLLAELARATEHYSGSDLKNLCVTAALKAVQQQVAMKKNTKHPLTQALFDEALKLVRPSSAEDMDSLVEIRKWAKKYGDGGSERKKQTIGFS